MTIISSMKPFRESRNIARNQMRAWASWTAIADKIIYFGEPEPSLNTRKTEYVESTPFPRIKTLALAAALVPTMACIVNADIVLADHTRDVLTYVMKRGGKAAVSRRYEFIDGNLDDARLVNGDWGVDFFFATPAIWRQLAKTISPEYRIGHVMWDSYVLSFFNTVASGATWDITKRRCVFHPKHEERKRPYSIQVEHTEMMNRCGMPFNRL